MSITLSHFAQGHSVIHRLDPRIKMSVALAFSFFFALSSQFLTLLTGLVLVLLLVMMTRLSVKWTLKRLRHLNLLNLLLFLILPLTTPGLTGYSWGGLVMSQEGLLLAAVITLKSNTILLLLTALLSTIDHFALGYALHQLYIPSKLVHLLFFTLRYIEVLYQEYQRLVQAMKVRGFQPRMNRHTYRSVAYLVGMLLVKSFDRSDRLLAAMKCRGFQGQFFLLTPCFWQRRDQVFSLISIGFFLVLLEIEWIY